MMSSSGVTQQSLRKALGTLKDSTQVGLAKVNSEYKDVDIAIVKATNHEEKIPKEKHIRNIFYAVSASRSRVDIQYCISSLARRLGKTRNWAVALKILIVIHRALREADPAFRGELINYFSSKGHMLNLSHFKDDSSPNAWDYSAWVRTYALYLEERLECFRVLKFDVETEQSCRMKELETIELLEHLPAFQQLLFRLLGCQPEGAAKFNSVIQYAFSIVAGESLKINAAVDSGTLNLVNKFFDMQRHDAVRALEIYRKAGQQAERLSDFYEFCQGLNLWKSEKFIRIKQPPESFAAAMEEYVKEAPRAVPLPSNEGEGEAGKGLKALPNHFVKLDDDKVISGLIPEPSPVDLLEFDDINWDASKLDGRNSPVLDIFADGKPSSQSIDIPEPANEGTTWELELVSMDESLGNLTVKSEGSQGIGGAIMLEELTLGGQLITEQLKVVGDEVVVDSTNPFGDPYGYIKPLPGQPSNSCTSFL